MAALLCTQGIKKYFPESIRCQKKLPIAISLWVKERTPVLCSVKLTNGKCLKGNKNLYFSELWQLTIPSAQEDESSLAKHSAPGSTGLLAGAGRPAGNRWVERTILEASAMCFHVSPCSKKISLGLGWHNLAGTRARVLPITFAAPWECGRITAGLVKEQETGGAEQARLNPRQKQRLSLKSC